MRMHFGRSALAAAVLLSQPIVASALAGQGPAEQLANALAQIRLRNLDSAITLLEAITSNPRSDSAVRAEAFLWLGVSRFYTDGDSSARVAFRDAVAINALLTPTAVLARLDSGLATLWESEQTTALCGEALPGWLPGAPNSRTGEPMNSAARAAVSPEIVSGPEIRYPDHLRQARMEGRVLARTIIDASGRAERASIHVLSATHPDFERAAVQYILDARFRAAGASGAPTRSCIIVPVDFTIIR